MRDTEKCQIQGYYELKSTFSQFAMLCEDQLVEEDNLVISFKSLQDITMDLAVFGQPLEISFSLTTDRKDTALGKLHFTRVTNYEKRQTVMTLYFNKYGFIRYSLDGQPSLHCILDKDSIQMIFAHLLVSYVKENQLSYLGNIEMEVDRMGDAFLTEH